jgi:hypothetical protein
VTRRRKHDVLDAVRRPAARKLGRDAIRFSTSPALGGRAAVVEIVPKDHGSARLRAFALSGHPGLGWTEESRASVAVDAGEYRRIAAAVDAAFAEYGPLESNTEDEVFIVCTDGPGYATERVRDGRVLSLAGSCPRNVGVEHANVRIACQIRKLLESHLAEGDRPYLIAAERCRQD